MNIHVSKGTYIRTIVDDLGELLGCGAHVSHLRRLAVGSYPIDRMITLPELEALLEQAIDQEITPSELLDPLLLPMQSAVTGMPKVYVDDVSANFLRHGNPVRAYKAPAEGSLQVYIGEDEHDENADKSKKLYQACVYGLPCNNPLSGNSKGNMAIIIKA